MKTERIIDCIKITSTPNLKDEKFKKVVMRGHKKNPTTLKFSQVLNKAEKPISIKLL